MEESVGVCGVEGGGGGSMLFEYLNTWDVWISNSDYSSGRPGSGHDPVLRGLDRRKRGGEGHTHIHTQIHTNTRTHGDALDSHTRARTHTHTRARTLFFRRSFQRRTSGSARSKIRTRSSSWPRMVTAPTHAHTHTQMRRHIHRHAHTYIDMHTHT